MIEYIFIDNEFGISDRNDGYSSYNSTFTISMPKSVYVLTL